MNEKLLRAEIILKGYSLEEFLKLCNFHRSTFYRKTKEISSFATQEVSKIMSVLDIPPKKMVNIFLQKKYLKRHRKEAIKMSENKKPSNEGERMWRKRWIFSE